MTSDQIEALVAAILGDLQTKRAVADATDRLKALGAAAAPALLTHLVGADRAVRTLAFYGLQFCWAPAAIEAVGPFLADDDAELRRMAAIVLVKGSGYGTLIEQCRPLLDHPNPAVADFALDFIEAEQPDLKRALVILADPIRRPALVRHLPRYHDPAFGPALLELARDPRPESRTAAIAALIHVNADGLVPRRAMVAVLTGDPEAAVRELAADYLTWHGTDAEMRAVNSAVRDSDPGVAAAASAGLAAIRRRAGLPRPPTDPTPIDASVSPGESWRAAAAGLEQPGDAAAWRYAWHAYRSAEPFEPHWAYRGRDPEPGFAADREARRALQARLFAIPGHLPADGHDRPPPVADRWVAPVRDFVSADDKSYGREIEDNAVKGFNGLIHVGRDVAWHRPHAGVHAVAAGVVRSVGCIATWGMLVVIEHRDRLGRGWCSLYGHLSPLVCVETGQMVTAGQKIGAVGRSNTWENGGYDAHLHFGIHQGPYLQPPRVGSVIDARYRGRPYRGVVTHADPALTAIRIRTERGPEQVRKATGWVCGYISRSWFEAGDHGWRDPSRFLDEMARL